MADTRYIKVRLGRLIYEAMQLDGIADEYGLSMVASKRFLYIEASEANMRRFADAVYADTWNADPRYAACAARSLPVIRRALDAEAK